MSGAGGLLAGRVCRDDGVGQDELRGVEDAAPVLAVIVNL